jgi:hypothetical protein
MSSVAINIFLVDCLFYVFLFMLLLLFFVLFVLFVIYFRSFWFSCVCLCCRCCCWCCCNLVSAQVQASLAPVHCQRSGRVGRFALLYRRLLGRQLRQQRYCRCLFRNKHSKCCFFSASNMEVCYYGSFQTDGNTKFVCHLGRLLACSSVLLCSLFFSFILYKLDTSRLLCWTCSSPLFLSRTLSFPSSLSKR